MRKAEVSALAGGRELWAAHGIYSALKVARDEQADRFAIGKI
jgi:hypothetical protein